MDEVFVILAFITKALLKIKGNHNNKMVRFSFTSSVFCYAKSTFPHWGRLFYLIRLIYQKAKLLASDVPLPGEGLYLSFPIFTFLFPRKTLILLVFNKTPLDTKLKHLAANVARRFKNQLNLFGVFSFSFIRADIRANHFRGRPSQIRPFSLRFL